MNRAYSILDIKTIDDDARIIEGIASTPTPDRMGDIVDPMGAKFSLPMPLLWQHQSSKPIGQVFFAKPTKDGIPFKAKIASTDEAGTLKDRLDEAWQSIKLGLVRAVSIGFNALKYQIMKDGGYEFTEWEWLELSAVTIPANSEATITSIRSFDLEQRAASGRALEVEHHPAGASALQKTKVVKAKEAKSMAKKTIADQIAAFEATRQAKAARMAELMDAAAEKGETLDAEAKQEYDGLEAEVKEIDEHLMRLRKHEAINKAAAVAAAGNDGEVASQTRSGVAAGRIVVTPKKLEKGILFTRFVLAQAIAKGNLFEAMEIAKSNEQWRSETPQLVDMLRMQASGILKTAVNPGTTSDSTWAGPLVNYTIMTSEFIEYLTPRTIIGQIQGLTRVPFKVKVPRQTGTGTVNWVGEGKVKPLTSLAFDTVTLEFAKIAGIIPLTEELIRFSNPSAELLVRNSLAKAIIQFMDSQFVDPTKASNDVSPASITNGVTPTTATGTTAAALRADVKTAVSAFLANNQGVEGLVWIMTQQQALAISLMQNSLGQPQFPGLTLNGGTFVGLPAITSENIPATGGSPVDGGLIILAQAPAILLADDGQVTVDASREASLQMDTAPDSPPTASTVMVSLWQNNMVAIKAERYINWAKARSTAVGFIQNAKYAE